MKPVFIQVLLLIGCLAHAASATDCDAIDYAVVNGGAFCTPDGFRLEMKIECPAEFLERWEGVRWYRHQIEDCSNTSVLVTPQPLPRPVEPPYRTEFLDTTADVSLDYSYWYQLVDTNGQDFYGGEIFNIWSSFGDCDGRLYLGQVRLLSTAGWTASYETCGDTCGAMTGGFLSLSCREPWEPALQDGDTVKLWGTMGCGFDGCFASATECQLVSCTVATEHKSWSSLKSQF